MINIPVLLNAVLGFVCGYGLVTLFFLLGLCRAAARAARMSKEAEPLINTPTSAPLAGIPAKIGISTL